MNITPSPASANEPVTVIGRHVRTDNAESIRTVPALWKEVREGGVLDAIPGRVSGDLYAVYTNLEHAGETNEGYFSFIICVPVVPSTPVPDGMTLATIPRSARISFLAPENDATRIIEAWQQAWAHDDSVKSFLCEYELYSESGQVSVNIGVRERLS